MNEKEKKHTQCCHPLSALLRLSAAWPLNYIPHQQHELLDEQKAEEAEESNEKTAQSLFTFSNS